MINNGLLTPDYIVDRILGKYHAQEGIPINACEGIIRQIIGWREFIRGVYVAKGTEERTTNFWDFPIANTLPVSFYTGETGILPVDKIIKKVLKTGYCHHIERLMVLGNFMLLCEIHPDKIYKWFMELFIDAYDWVMVPNVYGMSQFADGGVMSTKPYLSGSNYIMKMSDAPKGDWQEIWDGLFWKFIDKRRSFFLRNPRTAMMVRNFDKMDENKKQHLLSVAENYLLNLRK
jgi:deoxyribodipyrimidine photolyase-related protein